MAEHYCVVCEQPIKGAGHETVDQEFVCDECIDEVPYETLIEKPDIEVFTPGLLDDI